MMPLITLGPLRLSSYGIALLLALGLWWWWGTRRIPTSVTTDSDGLLFALAIGAWLGGRAGYVLGAEAVWVQLANLRALEFSWPGALIGTAGVLALYHWRRPVAIGPLLDALTLPTLCAQAIGAVGLWLAGTGLGVPWHGAWAVAQAGVWRHPVQLYEAGIALLAAAWCLLAPRLLPAVPVRWWLLGGIALNWLLSEGFRADAFTFAEGIRVIQCVGLGLLIVVSERVMMTVHPRVSLPTMPK
jgi:prolipoprotein diacylglyceryltransferase